MESPCDGHLEPAHCFRIKSKCLSIVPSRVVPPPLKHRHLSCSRPTVRTCRGGSPTLLAVGASVLLGCLAWDGLACISLILLKYRLVCELLLLLLPFSTCAWKPGLISVDVHSTSDFLFTHWIVSAKVPVGSRCLREGVIEKTE